LAWRRGPSKFYPHRCNDKGVGPTKLNFLLRFDRNLKYKRPAGAYPLRHFHKICRVCTSFQEALGVRTWLDLLKGLWSYGSFKLRGSGSPKFSVSPIGETMRQTNKRFRGERTCSRSSITVPSLVGLGFHPPPGWPKTLSFLPAALLAAQNCRYLLYSEADLRFFAPQGRHVAPMGVKFGTEEGIPPNRRSPAPCQIAPPSVQRQGCRTPKIEIFTQI